uniref:Uncharacterized protein n=1 Tax=viral metagenome TaxID=1070528 RepID=A0A6H1ZPL0_9ZZZZ
MAEKRIRRIIVYYGTRPIGHSPTERGKAERYCPVNVIVGTINPRYTLEELDEIALELRFQVEGDKVMGFQSLFRVGIEEREIEEDEYQEMKAFLDKYNERARKCFDDPTFICSEHIWSELLICGRGIFGELSISPVAPLSLELRSEDICEECAPDFHSLFILRNKDIKDSCKLFKLGGWRRETDLMPLR